MMAPCRRPPRRRPPRRRHAQRTNTRRVERSTATHERAARRLLLAVMVIGAIVAAILVRPSWWDLGFLLVLALIAFGIALAYRRKRELTTRRAASPASTD